MKDIFISYSANDMKMADVVRKHLQNYPTWAMKDGRAGDNYIEKIKEKLENCSSAILILSPSFFESEFIMNEELPALLERNKDPEFKLLPILLSICEPKDIEKLGTINIYPSRSKPMNRLNNEEWNFYMKQFKEQNLADMADNFMDIKNVTWKELISQFDKGIVVPNPMRGSRGLILNAGPEKKLELYIPTNGEDSDVELNIRAISTRIEKNKDDEFFVMSIDNEKLLEFFYIFSTYLDDEFTTSDRGLSITIKDTTKKWKDLTKEERSFKDVEKGLLGELWFLENLIKCIGQEGIKDWRGSDGDRHDFRLENEEFEIKTTSGNERVHYISSINQLEPSVDCNLTLISIQIAPSRSSKNSLSVNKLKKRIESQISSEDYLSLFHLKLKDYINDDLLVVEKMKTNYVLGAEPMYINVDDSFPRISYQEYTELKSHERISDIKYRLNVEGLGEPCGGSQFKKLLKKKGI